MRGLKTLVIGMGVLILVLAAVLIGELIRRAFLVSPSDGDTLFEASLGLPDGTEVTDISATRTRVAVLVTFADGTTAIYFVDPLTGQVSGVMTPTDPD